MRTLRLLTLLLAVLVLQPGCIRKQQPVPPPTEVLEQSKRDVTICILDGAMPDVRETHVKANGKQRVCWKGHGEAYEVRFKTADWPFKEAAHRTQADGWSIIDVPADAAGDFFTLKYKLSPGDEAKRHSYQVQLPSPTSLPDASPTDRSSPPTGPEIIGEG